MPKNCLSYPVEFVEDVFGASAKLAEIVGSAKVLLVADLNVVQRTENLGTRMRPESMTHVIPSIVTDVSAIDVARMTLRRGIRDRGSGIRR